MNIAEKIDHTILRADAREEEVKRYCWEAVQYHFASVCVNTCHVPLVAELLKGSGVKVCLSLIHISTCCLTMRKTIRSTEEQHSPPII